MAERVLICGSRSWSDSLAVYERVSALPEGTIVIEGGALGADEYAYEAAKARGLFVAEVECLDEHWELFGKGAGHRRNHAMLDLQPDLVIAFSLGSNGTEGTITEARRRGIPVEVYGPEGLESRGGQQRQRQAV